MITTGHPSFLELDRLALGDGTVAARHHLESCVDCRGYVGRLGLAPPIPAWVRGLPRERPRARWRVLWALPAVASLAALALFVLPREEMAVRSKGAPAVVLYIKHGEKVTPWDGHRSVATGDLLRLEVAPGSFGYVTVYTGHDARQVLYAGALTEAKPVLLPAGWEVDASPQAEILHVALSRGPLLAADAARLEAPVRDADLWRLDLTVPKQGAVSGSTP